MNSLVVIVASTLFHIIRSEINHAYLPGDVIIGGLFQIYQNEEGKCSNIAVSSVQHVEAVKWILKNLNEQDYIPDIDIGFLVLPTCRDTTHANNRTFELITKMRNEKYNECGQTYGPIAGIIGPQFSSEAENSSAILSALPSNERILQIGFSTTASSLSNSHLYKNFYRIIPNDDVQVQVMVLLMEKLQWNYIAIIYEDDAYGIGGKKRLEEKVSEKNICVAETFSIPTTGGISSSKLDEILRRIIRKAITGVVFYGTSSTANSLLKAAQDSNLKEKPTFIFSEATGLKVNMFTKENGNILDSGKGSFVVTPPKRNIEEFATYWKGLFTNTTNLILESITNPWLMEVFRVFTGCTLNNDTSLPGCRPMALTEINTKFEESVFESYAIETVLILCKVLKEAHLEVCYGASNSCHNFTSVLSKEKDRMFSKLGSVKFDFKNDFPLQLNTYIRSPKTTKFINHEYSIETPLPLYEVYHYRTCLNLPKEFCLEKIGNMSEDTVPFQLDTAKIKDYHKVSEGSNWPDVKKAQCSNGTSCSECLPKHLENEVYFEDGDLLVVGIVPIYNKDTNDPMGCDGIRSKSGVENAEGMAYAVKLVNAKSEGFADYFPNKKIGFIIINSCNQYLTIQDKILRLHHYGILMPNGTYMRVSEKIMAYVGGLGSTVSIAMSGVLSKLGYVQVSYASTSTTLSDRTMHPYFLRVCTPDDKQARSMVKLIKELNSNYIQIVYSEGAYGEGGRTAVKNAAKADGICIANEIKVQEGKYFSILDTLRKNPYAKIVIVFLRSHVVEHFTKAINDQMDYGEFMFLGSEAWGKNSESINGRKKFVGSITLALEMTQRFSFESYLNSINPASKNINPWFKHYVETKYRCYIANSFDKSSSKQCSKDLRLTDSVIGSVTSKEYYKQEQWTPFAINSMLAVLMGSNSAFNELCGTNSRILCDEFRRNPGFLWKKISEQKLKIFGTSEAVSAFDSNGDGAVGYRIYNVQRNSNNKQTLIFAMIGQSPLDEGQFSIEKSKLILPDNIELPSVCPNEKACRECFADNNELTTTSMSSTSLPNEGNNTITAVLGALVGCLVVAIIVLVILVICLCRGVPCQGKRDDLYLHPTQEGQSKEAYFSIRNSRINNQLNQPQHGRPDVIKEELEEDNF